MQLGFFGRRSMRCMLGIHDYRGGISEPCKSIDLEGHRVLRVRPVFLKRCARCGWAKVVMLA